MLVNFWHRHIHTPAKKKQTKKNTGIMNTPNQHWYCRCSTTWTKYILKTQLVISRIMLQSHCVTEAQNWSYFDQCAKGVKKWDFKNHTWFTILVLHGINYSSSLKLLQLYLHKLCTLHSPWDQLIDKTMFYWSALLWYLLCWRFSLCCQSRLSCIPE